MQMKNWLDKNFYKTVFIATILVTAFFSFFKLGSTLMNTDAQHWYLRSQNFAKAVRNLNFEKTYQDPKPGVPVMWLSGTGLETFLTLYEVKYNFRPELYTFDTFPLVQISAIGPLVVLNICFLVAFYFLVRKIFNQVAASISTILLGLHPFYLANTRFLHVDSTLTVFMTLSFLVFLFYLTRETKNKYILISGILMGLALLTKSQAGFLAVFVPLVLLLTYKTAREKNMKHYLKIYLYWLIACVVTYFIVFPAMWTNPLTTIGKIFGEAFFVANTGRTGHWDFFYYFNVMYREMSLPFLTVLIPGLFIIFYKTVSKISRENLAIISTGLFIILYFLAMSVIKQKVDRYMIPLFPLIFIVCAYTVGNLTKEKFHKKLIVSIFIFMLLLTAFFAPHFATFGHNTFSTNTYGSLYNEAGKYINSKPNSEHFTVVAMTKAYALKPFIKGSVYNYEDRLGKTGNLDYLVTNDYWLKTYGRPWYFSKCNKEKTIFWRGDAYWDIYKCSD